jgi:hypothetical protein
MLLIIGINISCISFFQAYFPYEITLLSVYPPESLKAGIVEPEETAVARLVRSPCCLCTSPISLLDNGSVNTLLRQRIHKQH